MMRELLRSWLGLPAAGVASSARSQAVGGDVDGSILVTGSHNTINVTPAEPPRPPLCTLPGRTLDFTGRERELDELCRALTSGDRRAAVSAVEGMGGVGKTTLAVEAAWRIAGEFPDGVLFVDLQGFAKAAPPLTPEQAMSAVIAQLEPTARPPNALGQLLPPYRRLLAGRRLLLLLDNARDHAQVADLLPPDPAATLVTSRHQLLLPGATILDLRVMSPAEALDLLRRVIGGARADNPMLATLADRCGRLPLALRAAGAYLKARPSLTVEAYIGLLASERERLTHLAVPRANLDVAAALGLSAQALEEDDSALADRWRRLAAFPAGFDAAAAAAVWGTIEPEAAAALDELAARALLTFEQELGRYRLHDLVRDLAVAWLDPAALEDARARHAAHYAEVLARAGDLYLAGGAGLLGGLALFDAERANVEAGQHWAARGAGSRDAAALAARYPNVGAYVLDLRLMPWQQIAWHEAALAACRRLGDRRSEGAALGSLGAAWAALGEARRAIEHHEQCLAIMSEVGDRRGEGNALGNLGLAWAALGEARRAVGYYNRALAIMREIGDQRGEGTTLGNLGNAWAALGEARKAIGLYEQALAISRKIGDRLGEGNALGNLGLAWAALGDVRKAIGQHEQALAISREIGDRRGEASDLGNLGNAWADLGEARRAIGFYERQLAIAGTIGDRRSEGNALMCLAISQDQLGDRASASMKAQAALAIYRQIENPWAKNAEAWLRDRGIDPDSVQG